MTGGLLNLSAVGNGNIILTGNPKKTFFKTTYCNYTNFGLQKFRIDFEGSKTINLNEKTHYDFKVPRNADLLMDTFLAIRLPNIWSTIVYNQHCEKWIPYSFQWIEHLGTQIIEEVTFTSGGTTLQRVSGQYLTTLVQREFTNTKNDLYNRMTGNIDELKNPSKFIQKTAGIYPDNYADYTKNPSNSWFRYGDHYPHVIRFDKDGTTPNKSQQIPQPSIRGRYLYIPMNIWYMLSSKIAFPLVALQYNELHIHVTLRPVREWFTINNVSATTNAACSGPDQRIRPNFSDTKQSFHRFIHPTPQITSQLVVPSEAGAAPRVVLDTADLTWEDTRSVWNSDVHLICTYGFLSDDERRNFAKQEQIYLFKSIYDYKFLGLHESNIVKLDALGMISSYTFFFRRSDADDRNEWSNYSNYEYNQINPFTQGVISAPHFAQRADGSFDQFFYTPSFNEKYNKTILQSFAILLDGKYRETSHTEGVYNYLDKYLKTAGDGPDGLYVYNFCLNSDPFVYQPSGALNMSKFKDVQFEFTILKPPENPNAQVLTTCDPETGALVGIQETANSIFTYTYDLYVFEERFNQVIFSNGNCGLLYAR